MRRILSQMVPYGTCMSVGARFLTRSVTVRRWLAGSATSRRLLRVEENKKSDLPYRLEINKFADGKLRELWIESSSMNHVSRRLLRRRCSASPIYGSEVRGQARRASRRN